MPEYRRFFVPGGTFFFTVVTFRRRPILRDEAAARLLAACLRDAAAKRPFTTEAIVVLPDHLHALWTLPPNDSAYGVRLAAIKAASTRAYLSGGGTEAGVSVGKFAKGVAACGSLALPNIPFETNTI